MLYYFALIDGLAGAFGVVFPDLPGCTAMGKTTDEALSNAADVFRDWAEAMEEQGAGIPRARSLEVLRYDPEVKRSLAGGGGLVLTKVA